MVLNDAVLYLIKLTSRFISARKAAEHQAGYEDRDKSHGMPR